MNVGNCQTQPSYLIASSNRPIILNRMTHKQFFIYNPSPASRHFLLYTTSHSTQFNYRSSFRVQNDYNMKSGKLLHVFTRLQCASFCLPVLPFSLSLSLVSELFPHSLHLSPREIIMKAARQSCQTTTMARTTIGQMVVRLIDFH